MYNFKLFTNTYIGIGSALSRLLKIVQSTLIETAEGALGIIFDKTGFKLVKWARYSYSGLVLSNCMR